MNIKEKINNLDKLTNKELIELVLFYLELVNKSFTQAEQCKNCNESCCDIFKNNYKIIEHILNKIIENREEKNLIKANNNKKNINKNKFAELNMIEEDYLASIEINNLEKKYL